MKNCSQTKEQTIYEHGISVRDHVFQIINYIKTSTIDGEWKLPSWLIENKEKILSKLLSENIIEIYTLFHDVGKPYCKITDENGKNHFPNHAEVSKKIWLEHGGDVQVGKLIGMDMMVHTMKAADVDSFIEHPEAVTLLLVGLAEVHANSKLFGGIESISFKMKWNQIDKRGKAIIKKI